MSEDIYGDAYEAFIDEIYKNGGGEPSAVRAAVDCATKSLTAERDALRAELAAASILVEIADALTTAIRKERWDIVIHVRDAVKETNRV